MNFASSPFSWVIFSNDSQPGRPSSDQACPASCARIARYWTLHGPPGRGLFAFLGPGLITGASDDDPSGIATYSQAGAQFGYGMAWVMLFSYPLMAAIQEISARIGRVTGHGIAGNIRIYYPGWLLRVIVGLLVIANIINLGADLGAMGDALHLWPGACGAPLRYPIGVDCARALEVFSRYERMSRSSNGERFRCSLMLPRFW